VNPVMNLLVAYVGVLISLLAFPICSTIKIIFLGWVKDDGTTKS
jgi:hypothetical protein